MTWLLGLLGPVGAGLLRVLAPALAVLAVVGAIALAVWRIHADGVSDGKMAADKAMAISAFEAQQQRADSLEKIAALAKTLSGLQAQLLKALADTRAALAENRQRAAEVIRENPEFAVVARPPELDRMRRADLDRIRAALGAAGLPAGSGAGVPPAGGGQGAGPGHD